MKNLQSKNISLTKQHGFTLVEIMVAVAVSLLLIAGIIQIFISNKQTYRINESLSRLQENGRFAIELLNRDVRMSGYMGCANLENITPNNIVSSPPPDVIFDLTNIINGDNNVTAGNSLNAVANTDTIVVRRASSDGPYLVGNMTADNANIQIGSNPSNFEADDILFITDCEDADIFRATNVSMGAGGIITIAHANSTNTTNRLSKAYGPDTRVMAFEANTYFIRLNPANNPALYRRPVSGVSEEMVEGVEDMQVLYGEDTDNDQMADQYVTANNVTDWSNVVSARISLLMQSLEGNLTSQSQSYTYNGATVTSTDRRLRKIMTTTIGIRNRLP